MPLVGNPLFILSTVSYLLEDSKERGQDYPSSPNQAKTWWAPCLLQVMQLDLSHSKECGKWVAEAQGGTEHGPREGQAQLPATEVLGGLSHLPAEASLWPEALSLLFPEKGFSSLKAQFFVLRNSLPPLYSCQERPVCWKGGTQDLQESQLGQAPLFHHSLWGKGLRLCM